MKKLTLLFIGSFICLSVWAQQGIFYKADMLRKQYNETTKIITITDEEYNAVKDLYPDTLTKVQVIEQLRSNPFYTALKFNSQAGSGAGGAWKFNIGNLAGLDVTKYANAIADIMIERAKQELTVAFFDRFKKFSEANPEFKILFPKTTDVLSKLLTYAYPQWLPTLRASFFDDLKQITYHLDDVMELPRYQTLLQNFPEVRIAIRSLRLVHEIETGASNAADIIKEFAGFPEWKTSGNKKIESVGSCIRIAALFSESIRYDATAGEDHVWVPANQLKKLFYDEIFFNLYMGLLYQQSINQDIDFVDLAGNHTDFEKILLSQKDNLFLFQNKLKEFCDLAGNVNVAFKDLRKKMENDEKPSNDDIYNYISTSIDVIDYSFGIVKVFNQKPVADEYIALMRKSNDLYKSLYTQKYSQAITQALDVFTMLKDIISPQVAYKTARESTAVTQYGGQASEDVKKLAKSENMFRHISGEEVDKVALQADLSIKDVQTVLQYQSLEKLAGFIEKVKPYALFITNMIEADTEAEVKAALENAILPVGSSSIKKYTRSNLTVQSYLGAFLATTTHANADGTWSDKFGVTAPIGLSYTPGFLSWKRGGSLSLFVPLLDIGAIVDYKLTREQDPTSTDPNKTVVTKDYKVELGQIFSPGVFAVYGFPWNIPVSLGYGAQYGPGLSKVDAAVSNPSWRWNFFLSVDLPFFNLINKTKYTKTK